MPQDSDNLDIILLLGIISRSKQSNMTELIVMMITLNYLTYFCLLPFERSSDVTFPCS